MGRFNTNKVIYFLGNSLVVYINVDTYVPVQLTRAIGESKYSAKAGNSLFGRIIERGEFSDVLESDHHLISNYVQFLLSKYESPSVNKMVFWMITISDSYFRHSEIAISSR